MKKFFTINLLDNLKMLGEFRFRILFEENFL